MAAKEVLLFSSSNSRDASLYPSGNSYTLYLSSPVKNIERIDLVSARVPNTIYNLTNGTGVLVPYNSPNIFVYNPVTNTQVSLTAHGQSLPAFSGGVLTPSGNVIMMAYTSSYFGMFDPVAATFSTFGPANPTINKYSGGTLLPDGRIVCVPATASNVGVISTMVPVDPAFCLGPFFNKF